MSGWPFDDTIPDVEMIARATVRQRQTDNGLQPLGDKLAGQLLTAGQLVTMPPPRWLIDDLLGASTLAVLYGKPGSGKSFLALDWALCVAAGMPWNGREVRSGTVLYVAAEGVGGLGIRVRAWTETFRVNLDKIDCIRFFPTAINLLDPARRQGLVEMSLALEPTFVIIDTLARSMVGGDENSTRDVGLAIDAADHVKTVTGATVLVVHHTSKGGETYRGSSSIEGAADTMILVEAEGANLTVKCEKAKDAEQFQSIKLTRSVVTLRGQMTTSCVLQSHEAIEATDELASSEQVVLAAMWDLFETTAAVSRTELKDLVKLPKQTFYRATRSLIGKSALINVGTMSRPVYKLPAKATAPEARAPRRDPGWASLEPDWAAPSEGPTP
jgi:hypothetical protein